MYVQSIRVQLQGIYHTGPFHSNLVGPEDVLQVLVRDVYVEHLSDEVAVSAGV
jgi:hypothetical protein